MIKILGCGDLFINKRLPQKGYPGLEELISVIDEYDAKFGNLETTVHNNEGYPACFPGGGWAMASSEVLQDVKKMGFNMVSFANNHAMDYSHKGLEATISHLNESGLSFVGAGRNLMEASLPKYVECSEGRVGFIAITSSFHDSDAAGPSGGIVPGRPGVNPLRHKAVYQVTPDLYEALDKVAVSTGMNETFQWSIKNGYKKQTSDLHFRGMVFTEGEENVKISHPLKKDMDRTVRSITEAKIQSDCVVVSVHSHQMSGDDETPVDFIVEFCHNCIDAGADVIFCHGAHILRGIEVYHAKPVFYGLGDFVFHNEMMSALPYEFYEKYDVGADCYDLVGIGMQTRSHGGTKGLSADPLAWQSIMAGIELTPDGVKAKIYPIELHFKEGRTKRGWPTIASDSMILERVSKMSKEKYGTEIFIEDNIGYINMKMKDI